ncbi:LPXTG cell wall anchor domain-containing protein [Enterocloster bolteae]|nr:LPXTG cell wall anchor domain-containing protein [Enterocloster bolteae]
MTFISKVLDEDVPLAPLPKTGEGPRSYYLAAVISSLLSGLYIALHGRKRDS